MSKPLSLQRLMELRSVLLDGFEFGPLDRTDLNEVLCQAITDAEDAERIEQQGRGK